MYMYIMYTEVHTTHSTYVRVEPINNAVLYTNVIVCVKNSLKNKNKKNTLYVMYVLYSS